MPDTFDPVPMLAEELQLPAKGVAAVCQLLDEGGTVPFIARYRKEATGALDEVQIRAIEERRAYLLELEQRRDVILDAIRQQDKLTDELRARIMACTTKAALEDLYLPYKPKRRTRATIARQRGLEPLASRILEQPAQGEPLAEAEAFVDAELGVADTEAALAGARDIVAESVAENADVRGCARRVIADQGQLVARMHPDKTGQRTKFEQYYDFHEPVSQIPSHRFLALRRGEREKALRVTLEVESEAVVVEIERMARLKPASPFAGQLRLAIQDCFVRLLAPSVDNDIRAQLKQRSDEAAVDVFASNLRNLLLAPPLGSKRVVGIDPGLRTGCKCVAADDTGKFLETITIYLGQGPARTQKSEEALAAFLERHRPFAVAVGNGTGGREAEAFTRKLLKARGLDQTIVVAVSEAGASVYSASELARQEFPDLDVTIRGAISIARRLQDPLAELVKIEPRAIGVGQYQHDVHQPLLQRKLDEVVESCVNQVGVELNTASGALLGRVAGIGPSLANNIVRHRETNGPFETRAQLLKVAKLGPRTFEQAAGFLRVRGGKHPLDQSAVHPERYDLVRRMAGDLAVEVSDLVGNDALVQRIEIQRYIGDGVGEPTLRDILQELRKPGRDPRSSFEPPRFRDDVMDLDDLTQGMVLEGVVTNVTAFGAFVDVGVHQDGLVHISQLSDRFVKDPHEVVQVGDRVTVRVLEVDVERRRISLTARSAPGTGTPREGGARKQGPSKSSGAKDHTRKHDGPRQKPEEGNKKGTAGFTNNPFADLLRRR